MDRALIAVSVGVALLSCSSQDAESSCIVRRQGDPNATWSVSWDAMKRVKSEHATADANSPVRLAWRYAADGRVLAFAGFGPNTYDNFQNDYVYDDHANLIDDKVSHPQVPDLDQPSSAEVWRGISYVNEYDDSGRLQLSTATPYGPGSINHPEPTQTSFQEDSEGRCERLEIKHQDSRRDWVEIRSYDDSGRLHSIERDYVAAGPPFWQPCEAVLTLNEYGEEGRILRATTQAAPGHGCDEAPYYTESYQYAAKGGVRVEYIDYTTDLPNDEIVVNGVSTQVGHVVETRTAACAEIEEQIMPSSDLRCAVD